MPMKLSLVEPYNKANIFRGIIQFELNSLLDASYLVGYISVYIRFHLEIYLLSNGLSTKTVRKISVPTPKRKLILSVDT